MKEQLLDQSGIAIPGTMEVPTMKLEEEVKEFKLYPHGAPAGRFIGEYLQPPPSGSIINPTVFDPMKRTDAKDAIRKYLIGPSLMYVHQIGTPKVLRDSVETHEMQTGDIVIPQGNVDAHVWNGKMYCTVRFDNVISIIRKGTEDYNKILNFNKIKIQ